VPRRQVNDERKLFVGNLAWAVDGLDLEDIFKEFGTVESAQARRPTRAAEPQPRTAVLAARLRRRVARRRCDRQLVARATANPSRMTQLCKRERAASPSRVTRLVELAADARRFARR
jgi:RNA recognition motif-containing protein